MADEEVFVLRALSDEEKAASDEQERFKVIPEQTQLLAEIEECTARDSIFHEDNDPEKPLRKEVSFKFKVIDDDYTGRVLWGTTTQSFVDHPNCKLRNWVQSILGVDELPPGFTFRPSRITGAICRVVVEHGKPKADGTVRERVRTVLPATDDTTAESAF